MNLVPLRALVLSGALASGLTAQQRPPVQLPPGMTPEQAARMIQERPELGPLLRERLRQSGLSPDQVRAQLRAAGYPSSLLDTYLGADTLGVPDPTLEMITVVSQLGLARFSLQDSLLLTGDTVSLQLFRDSLRAESIAREDSLARFRRGLTLFGLDVFRQPTTRFTPLVTGPVDDSYVLGPGDQLVLILTGAVEIARQLEVTTGGFVVIPQVGQIHVNGITLGQLKDLLYERLGRVYSGISRGPNSRTRFDVAVSSVRTHMIRVIGEVPRPGAYPLAATGTVLSALYEAGGLTERGNFRAVELRRGTRLLATVDLYDYLLTGTLATEVALASGDVIFVPVRGNRVSIAGEVTRPAVYEVKPEETLRDLVRIAGGLTPQAATAAVTVHRILPPEQRPGLDHTRTVVTVDLGRALAGEAAPTPLVAGDSVTIFSIRSGRRNAVTVRGDGVWQPGTYQLEPGMRLSDVIRMAGGLKPDVYQGRVQVLRTYADSTKRMLGAHLATASAPAPQPDVELMERDEVTVYARTEFITRRPIAVHGAVRRPGMVAYADSMTLRDAVLLAGGTTEGASLFEAEVSRLQQPGSDSVAVVLRVPLDSSFLLDDTGVLATRVGATSAPEVILQPYDNVLIRRIPGFELPRNVVVTGEVQFPGTYTLLKRDERVSSVLERAGGLTPNAHPNGIRFFRRAMPMPQRPDPTRLDAPRPVLDRLRQDSLAVARFGGTAAPGPFMTRVAVDLQRALRDGGSTQNVVLQAGDSIYIPRYESVVRVEGSVYSPGGVAYRPGAGLGYYIDAAGGHTREADRGKAFVQQPSGLSEKGRPQPGSVVFVPLRTTTRVGPTFVEVIGALAPLISAITTVAVLIITTSGNP